MNDRTFSSRFLHQFVDTIAREIGQESLSIVLDKAGLPSDWSDPTRWESLTRTTPIEVYARLQKAMRTYYGRGARGILIRVGNTLWQRLLDDAPLTVKAQSRLIFGLSLNVRRKLAMELLAKLLAGKRGAVTVHTLDQDLLLSDKDSPGTLGQNESECICYVTLGLLRECLYWATGQEHDIEETSCRAKGEEACEFKVTIGE